jgi:carboxypeptidase family protein
MRNRGILIVVGVAALAGVAWWLWHRTGKDGPATSQVTQPVAKPVAASAPRADEARAHLAVSVRDDKGPLAGATVRIAPEDGDVELVTTDKDGRARAELAAGDYAISAAAAAHQPAAARKKLAAGEDGAVELVLGGGGRTLSGTVSDTSGGPIAGARVDAARLDNHVRPSDAVASALTGADGKYQLTVAEGQLLVAARSGDYAPQARYVEMGPNGAVADFALVPGGVIEGVVRDERTKQPVAGAAVSARIDAPAMLLVEPGARRVTAGADGKFRIAGLRPGAYQLAARAGAQRSKAPTLVGIGVADQISDVELLVGSGPVVRGTVVDADSNQPVAGAHVVAFGEARGGDDATADAKGAFAIEGLVPGRYMMIGSDETHLSAGETPVQVIDKDVDGKIVRVRGGQKVTGHVEPRQVCDVRFDRDQLELGMAALLAPTTTAADGAFTFAPLPPGKATLAARCPSGDQGEAAVEVAPGVGEVTVKVTPGGSIAGRVVDAEGKAIAGVAVHASPLGGGERTMIVNGVITSGAQALTTAAGTFELRGLAADSYRLRVLERGRPLRARGKPVKVTLAAAEKKTGVELAVDRPNGVIKGVVTGPDGAPLADAWVSVQQDLMSNLRPEADDEGGGGGGERRMTMIEASDDGEGGGGSAGDIPPVLTDAQGRFAIGGLPHAAFDIVAEAKKGTLRGRAANITPDATVSLQALGLTTLSGTVRGPNGAPALFSVELEGPTAARRSFTDGAFSIGRVDPGAYVVRVTSSDGNGEAKLTVQPGQPATVEISLVANAVVVGMLVDGAGKPVAGLPLTVVDDTGDGRVQVMMEGPPPTSGPDGKFRVEHKAGKVALIVLGGPAPVTRKGLVLEPGKTFDVGAIRVDSGPPPKP